MSKDIHELSQRKLNFFQTIKAVSWAFFGVRKGKDYHQDIANLNPVHLIIAGALAALLFVGGLVLIARWVVTSVT
ncbi:DUF2970 domain-containing protein [Paralcaligenes sp. KSB-10]|jgi:hypothetical protein|uniref:DUF2970 domain-containing protein n=1 Tax=Paralcaligenes sp. KSB-10 TaxID=2901142 RepID=UPI001E59E4A1|nr:DUF2970 domain-containing protein [Paralcaligenes sp. KSB-10]UHL63792.1 DUF2970 domain-containing protein [Paralcaligenes sp. KSB-10]